MKTVTIKTPDFKQSFQIELATAQDMTHAIDHYSFTEDGNIKVNPELFNLEDRKELEFRLHHSLIENLLDTKFGPATTYRVLERKENGPYMTKSTLDMEHPVLPGQDFGPGARFCDERPGYTQTQITFIIVKNIKEIAKTTTKVLNIIDKLVKTKK